MEEVRQWPLTAAATQLLLAIPASNAKPAGLPAPKDSVKLGLKELIVRGAYRVDIEQGRWGSKKVTRPKAPLARAANPGRLEEARR